MNIPRALPIISLSFLVVITGCNVDGDQGGDLVAPYGAQPGGSTSATIGLTGGRLNYGALSITVPFGALSSFTDVAVGIPETEPGYVLPDDVKQIDYIYESKPAGTTFDFPVSVVFMYSDQAVANYDESTVTIWTFAGEGDTLVMLDDLFIDFENNTVIGVAGHLAYFVMTVSTDVVYNSPPPAPELISPHDGAVDTKLDVIFWWMSTTNTLFYHIQISTDEDFTLLVHDVSGLTGTLHGIAGVDQNTQYYWHVRAQNQFGAGPWSDIQSFTTGDGCSINTFEGIWEYDFGEWGYFIDDTYYYRIESWGSLVLILLGGVFDAEGELSFHKTMHSYVTPGILAEETYSFNIDEEGTYTVEDNTMPIFPYDNFLKMEINWSIDPDRISLIEEKGFDLLDDTLLLHLFGVGGLENWGSGRSYYNRLY